MFTQKHKVLHSSLVCFLSSCTEEVITLGISSTTVNEACVNAASNLQISGTKSDPVESQRRILTISPADLLTCHQLSRLIELVVVDEAGKCVNYTTRDFSRMINVHRS